MKSQHIQKITEILDLAQNDPHPVSGPFHLHNYLSVFEQSHPLRWTIRFTNDYLDTVQIRHHLRLKQYLETLISLSDFQHLISDSMMKIAEEIWYLKIDTSELTQDEVEQEVLYQRAVSRLYASIAQYLDNDYHESKKDLSRVISVLSQINEDKFWDFLKHHFLDYVNSECSPNAPQKSEMKRTL